MNIKEKIRIINILNSMSIACSNGNEFNIAHCLASVATAMMDDRTRELSACIYDGFDKSQLTATLKSEPLPEELAAQDGPGGSP